MITFVDLWSEILLSWMFSILKHFLGHWRDPMKEIAAHGGRWRNLQLLMARCSPRAQRAGLCLSCIILLGSGCLRHDLAPIVQYFQRHLDMRL